VGDSITEGLYPAALQGLLGTTADVGNFGSGGTCVVINNGGVAVPYITTAVCQQAQQFMPTTVVIMLGTNDTDPDIYKYISRFVADYEQLVRQFQAVSTHPKIWLVKPPAIYGTPYGLNNTNLVNGVIPRISQVASEMGLSTIDVYSATTGHPEYFVDGVHPNSKGAAVIANVIAEAIR
jgi:alpha-L-fucosidase 2